MLAEMKVWRSLGDGERGLMQESAEALVRWAKGWVDQVVPPWEADLSDSHIQLSGDQKWFGANRPLVKLIDTALFKALKELQDKGISRPLTAYWVAVGDACMAERGKPHETGLALLMVRVRNTAHLVHAYNENKKDVARRAEIASRGLFSR